MHRIFILVTALLAFINVSCSQNRTYLTEQEKEWNPYREGQILIFGTSDGRADTMAITRVEDKRFPDGIGALENERLGVLVRISSPSISKKPIDVMLLHLLAKTTKDPSEISFELRLGGGSFWGKTRSFEELEGYSEFSLQTQGRKFDDVIEINDNSNQVFRGDDIATIFWSKSVGYIKCIKKDGTIWELVNIIKAPN